jgi:hypothetical protein
LWVFSCFWCGIGDFWLFLVKKLWNWRVFSWYCGDFLGFLVVKLEIFGEKVAELEIFGGIGDFW